MEMVFMLIVQKLQRFLLGLSQKQLKKFRVFWDFAISLDDLFLITLNLHGHWHN